MARRVYQATFDYHIQRVTFRRDNYLARGGIKCQWIHN